MNENDSCLNSLKFNKNKYKFKRKIDDKIALLFSINNCCFKKNTKRKIIILSTTLNKTNKGKQIKYNNVSTGNTSYNSDEENYKNFHLQNDYIEEENSNNNSKINSKSLFSNDIGNTNKIIKNNSNINLSSHEMKIKGKKKCYSLNIKEMKSLNNKNKKIFMKKNKIQLKEKDKIKLEDNFNNNFFEDNNIKILSSNNFNNKVQKKKKFSNKNYIVNCNKKVNKYIKKIENDIRDNSKETYNEINKVFNKNYINEKEEDIFDYININDPIYYQNMIYGNDNEIINEPIEEVEEENENSELTSLSTENILKSVNKNNLEIKDNIDENNMNKIKEKKEISFKKHNTGNSLKSNLIKKNSSFSRFININNMINKNKINDSKKIVDNDKKIINKIKKEKNKSVNNSFLFEEKYSVSDISAKNKKIKKIYETNNNKIKIYSNYIINIKGLNNIKNKTLNNNYNLKNTMNEFSLNNNSNKNKICLSLIH